MQSIRAVRIYTPAPLNIFLILEFFFFESYLPGLKGTGEAEKD